ncbi:hypothetical protein SRB5_03810 [Streptomyces sp. RB5]|uniref:Nitrate ABC transporter substrate-binding protein n=1 Tax=Streptomyces smaragdinus TaxID=2585196 RepID=A0A7K0CBY0_9ACTN|nr:hypothetical protein [Streptomyces smaragdinus]MQY10274.1 hypothetical protein [Streptomyces smaragdinus]
MSVNRPVAAAAAAALLALLTACGDDGGGDEPKATRSAAASAGAVDLSGVCPEKIVVQGQWLPNTSSEGPMYSLLGPNPSIDADKDRVTAPLTAGGKDTGVDLEIRAGGPAIGFQQVSAQMYTDKSITLGILGGFDEAIQLSKTQPTLAVLAMLEKDPQMIFWDPKTHPEFTSIADIGKTDTTVLYFDGDTYMDYLVGAGVLKKSQVDGSNDGSPARFVTERGKIASGGYAVEDPYTYEKEVDEWGKPVRFQLLYDAGYPNYGPPLSIRPDDREKLAPCLKKLIPVVQQAQLDFLANPGPTIDATVKISEAYASDDIFTKEIGEYSAAQLKKLGIAANDAEGKDSTTGNFDEARVQKMIELTEPVFAAQKKPVKPGLKPSDLVTDEFIDPEIGFPGGS